MSSWKACRKILCVRPDNMGDVLMSAPAISALKETFGSHITLLTSTAGAAIAPYVPGIDDVVTWDVPWVKGDNSDSAGFMEMANLLRRKGFDAAVLFTVFSQNPLPAALLTMQAGIPLRLAWCRENPYRLLTHWMPDEEPYTLVRHQVRRDLDLVASVGATTNDETIRLRGQQNEGSTVTKLAEAGVVTNKPWIVLHPGVSEIKRSYPADLWSLVAKKIVEELEHQVIVTGTGSEHALAADICKRAGKATFNLAGALSLGEFISLIKMAPLIISVNTGTIHIAAAAKTPVIVLYALTNPQHTPWKGIGKVMPYSVPEDLQSRNEVLRFVQRHLFRFVRPLPDPADVTAAAHSLLVNKEQPPIPELVF